MEVLKGKSIGSSSTHFAGSSAPSFCQAQLQYVILRSIQTVVSIFQTETQLTVIVMASRRPSSVALLCVCSVLLLLVVADVTAAHSDSPRNRQEAHSSFKGNLTLELALSASHACHPAFSIESVTARILNLSCPLGACNC